MGIEEKHPNILHDAYQSPSSNYTWQLSKFYSYKKPVFNSDSSAKLISKVNLCTIIICRDFQKAADTAFQNRSMEELEEVEGKVIRFPQLMEHVRMLKSKLGYR